MAAPHAADVACAGSDEKNNVVYINEHFNGPVRRLLEVLRKLLRVLGDVNTCRVTGVNGNTVACDFSIDRDEGVTVDAILAGGLDAEGADAQMVMPDTSAVDADHRLAEIRSRSGPVALIPIIVRCLSPEEAIRAIVFAEAFGGACVGILGEERVDVWEVAVHFLRPEAERAGSKQLVADYRKAILL